MKIYHYLFLCIGLFVSSCATTVQPVGTYPSQQRPTAPDYSNPDHWAALPTKSDAADRTPGNLIDEQETAAVDVFFMYPTIYDGSEKYQTQWNAPIDNAVFNQAVEGSTIQFQASAFNAAGRIYAPRYRQAHINAYYNADTTSAQAAFELAYQDLKTAFQYYLDNYNEGRPIIIAAHSQGTTHGKRLMRDFFDGKPLQQQLVAAYLVGIPVAKDYFEHLPICEYSTQTGCFVTWRTWKRGILPADHQPNNNIAVTNPLTWTIDEAYAPEAMHEGGVLYKFEKIYPNLTDAEIHDGILWANKPQFFGSLFFTRDNYHIGDYNLYYLNVRTNAQARTSAFLNKKR
ncbi:MAG: DUF3089 domain-containing protein [Bacteroidota bacterium]